MWNVPEVLLLMQCVMGGIRMRAQKTFVGLAGDEIQSLTAQKIENLEADRMLSESVRKFPFWLEDATGPEGHLKSYVTKSLESCSSLTKNTWTMVN